MSKNLLAIGGFGLCVLVAITWALLSTRTTPFNDEFISLAGRLPSSTNVLIGVENPQREMEILSQGFIDSLPPILEPVNLLELGIAVTEPAFFAHLETGDSDHPTFLLALSTSDAATDSTAEERLLGLLRVLTEDDAESSAAFGTRSVAGHEVQVVTLDGAGAAAALDLDGLATLLWNSGGDVRSPIAAAEHLLESTTSGEPDADSLAAQPAFRDATSDLPLSEFLAYFAGESGSPIVSTHLGARRLTDSFDLSAEIRFVLAAGHSAPAAFSDGEGGVRGFSDLHNTSAPVLLQGRIRPESAYRWFRDLVRNDRWLARDVDRFEQELAEVETSLDEAVGVLEGEFGVAVGPLSQFSGDWLPSSVLAYARVSDESQAARILDRAAMALEQSEDSNLVSRSSVNGVDILRLSFDRNRLAPGLAIFNDRLWFSLDYTTLRQFLAEEQADTTSTEELPGSVALTADISAFLASTSDSEPLDPFLDLLRSISRLEASIVSRESAVQLDIRITRASGSHPPILQGLSGAFEEALEVFLLHAELSPCDQAFSHFLECAERYCARSECGDRMEQIESRILEEADELEDCSEEHAAQANLMLEMSCHEFDSIFALYEESN